MSKLTSWQLKLFYLILFLVPSNLAKHFILPSSYVSGILVDYLIPTIYLTDILIILLLLSNYLPRLLANLQGSSLKVKQLILFRKNSINPLFIFLLLLLPSVILASSPIPAIYKWLKLLELVIFTLWIKKNLNLTDHLNPIINVLSASVLFQSLLSLTQWFKQASVFGFKFLGEQPFNSATPGIDKITWFTGAIKIPPLGTFPHPNILGGFLAVTLPLILYKLLCKGSEPLHEPGSELPVKVRNLIRLVIFLLGLTTLFLTFSLSAWLAFLLIGLPSVILLTIKIRPLKLILIYSGLFLILFSFVTKLTFLAPASSFSRRSELAKIALKMIRDKPMFGIGLNNFTIKLENYGHVTATTRFLQPVHNIYLLILSETGFIGLIGFIYLFGSILLGSELPVKVRNLQKTNKIFWIAFSTLLFLGLFDHYPFTVQQSLLLFFYIFSGLPRVKSRGLPRHILRGV
jgi:O-antigen ligase